MYLGNWVHNVCSCIYTLVHMTSSNNHNRIHTQSTDGWRGWWWSYRMNKKAKKGGIAATAKWCVCVYVVHLTLIRWINRNRWIVNNLPIFIYMGPARSQCIQRICRLFRDGGAHLFRYRHTGPAGSRLLSGTDRVEREREREREGLSTPFSCLQEGLVGDSEITPYASHIYRREFCSNAPFDGKAHGPAS